MTESTCLHIQDRESGPIRVVELPWISVRIGRATYCEVRLAGPDLPDEVCRLQHRGLTWRLLSVGGDCPVFMNGQRLGGVCVLPFNVPFRAGPYCFTLRQDRSVQPDWHMYAGPAPLREDVIEKPPLAELEPDPVPMSESLILPAVTRSRIAAPSLVADTARLRRNTIKPPVTDKRRKPKHYGSPPLDCYEQWDARWKALNAKVSARAESRLKVPEFGRPVYRSDLEPVPLKEAHTPLIEVPANADLIQQLQPETIVSQVPVPAPTSSTKAVELRKQLTDFSAELLVEEPLIAAPQTDNLPVVDSVSDALDLISAPQTDNPIVVADVPDEQQHIEAPKTTDLLTVGDIPDALDLVPAPRTADPIAVADDPDAQHIVAPQTADPLAVDDVPDAQQSTAPPQTADPGKEFASLNPVDMLPDCQIEDVQSELEPTKINQPVYQDDSEYEAQPRHAPPSLTKDVEWPSVKDILAVYQAARPCQSPVNTSKTTTKKISRSSLMPTPEREPSSWAPPIVLAGPVAVIFVLAAGLLGCSLSWSWAQDSFAAAIVTDRLLTNDSTLQRSPIPDSVQPPSGSWLTSTPAHLASWAVFLGHFRGEENQTPDETLALLQRALAASPVNAQARLTQALLEPVDSTKAVSSRSVGLSRDVASLSCSARRLVAAGKKDEALALFGRALSLAVPEKSSRYRVPRFSEDPGVPRYLLPDEEPVREIIVEFISQNTWNFEEWSRVLPENPVVLIAAARLLRERGRGEVETILDRILKQTVIPPSPFEAGPVKLAACAEALAFRARFNESQQLYHQAIDLIDDPTIRRSWWFNLADIAYRSDDDIARQAALRLASAVAFSDDITRRATDIQRTTLVRSTGVKAN